MGVISTLSGCFGRSSSKVPTKDAPDAPEAPKSLRGSPARSAENRAFTRAVNDRAKLEEERRKCPIYLALDKVLVEYVRRGDSPRVASRVSEVRNAPTNARSSTWFEEREAGLRTEFQFIDEQRAMAAHAQNRLVESGQTFITAYICPPTPLVLF